jgi:uncharacterized protein (DUF362 family)
MDPVRLRSITRRSLLGGAAATAAVVAGGLGWRALPLRQARQRVTTIAVPDYQANLDAALRAGLDRWPAMKERIAGARVLLKPNLVEHSPERPVNTHPALVAAAVRVLRGLGAAEVTVGEGPGHRRDSEALLLGSGLGAQLSRLGCPFVDLNYDQPVSVPLLDNLSGLHRLPVALGALDADLVVSMPKLKTHHWAGVTLSMKNLFGTTCGAELGWPKNSLHWAGIEAVIVDLWRSLPCHFAIVDGVEGMQGDGPIMGEAVPSGFVAMGDHLPAVDATCARLMGIDATRLPFLRLARSHGATIASSRIDIDGDPIQPLDFALLERWGWLSQAPPARPESLPWGSPLRPLRLGAAARALSGIAT